MMWVNWDSALGLQTTQPVPAASAPKVTRWSRGEQEDPYPEVAGMQSWMPEMARLS